MAKENKKMLKELFSKLGPEVLTEDVLDEITEVFNGAVDMKTAALRETIQEELEVKNREELAEFKTNLVETADKFLEEAVSEYIVEDDKINMAIENEIYSNLFTGLKEVFAENNLKLPAKDARMVDRLQEQIESLKEDLNTSKSEVFELREEVLKEASLRVFAEETSDLTENEVTKLQKIMEEVEFDTVESLKTKIDIFKKNFLKESEGSEDDDEKVVSESLSTSVDRSKGDRYAAML